MLGDRRGARQLDPAQDEADVAGARRGLEALGRRNIDPVLADLGQAPLQRTLDGAGRDCVGNLLGQSRFAQGDPRQSRHCQEKHAVAH